MEMKAIVGKEVWGAHTSTRQILMVMECMIPRINVQIVLQAFSSIPMDALLINCPPH